MTLAALALFAHPAHACQWIEIDVESDVPPCTEDHDEPRTAAVSSSEPGQRDEVQLHYGMQFLPDAPAHHIGARLVGEHDAYISGELRYMPVSDILWTGRLGAGFDVLPRSSWDFTLGLWLGSAGEWDRQEDRAVLYNAPIGGTEVGLAVEGERLFAKYRWLAGIGGGPIDEMLTENELTVGYKIFDEVHAYGQYLVLSPGELDNRSGVGLGMRVVF